MSGDILLSLKSRGHVPGCQLSEHPVHNNALTSICASLAKQKSIHSMAVRWRSWSFLTNHENRFCLPATTVMLAISSHGSSFRCARHLCSLIFLILHIQKRLLLSNVSLFRVGFPF